MEWLQNTSIAQYLENHPEARSAIVAAVQKPETLSTPISIPCYTSLTDEQAPTPLALQPATLQEYVTVDNQTDLFVEPRDRYLQAVEQELTQRSKPSYQAHVEGINDSDVEYATSGSPHSANSICQTSDGEQGTLRSRRLKRTYIEEEAEVGVRQESSSSLCAASLKPQLASERDTNTHQQPVIPGSCQDDEISSPAISLSTSPQQVGRLRQGPSKNTSANPIYCLYNEEPIRFIKLPQELRSKMQKIASAETLAWAWQFFSIMRNPSPCLGDKDYQDNIDQTQRVDVITASDQRLRELKDHIVKDEEKEKLIETSKRMVQVSKRLHLAELIGRFLEEDDRRAAEKKRRKKNSPRVSTIDRFANLLFPEMETSKGKKKFENWRQWGLPWARMAQHFGCGVILLVPHELTNEE